MVRIRRFLPILALAVATALTSAASANEGVQRRIAYNPTTKSYFEVRNDLTGWEKQWPGADKNARRHHYHGVAGRLAVVTDQATMDFLHDRLGIRGDTWIGARYFCGYSRLIWVNGKVQTRSDYSKWASQWHRTHIRCPNVSWMPLYVRAFGPQLFWQASGPGKGFTQYLVEYRTGRP